MIYMYIIIIWSMTCFFYYKAGATVETLINLQWANNAVYNYVYPL